MVFIIVQDNSLKMIIIIHSQRSLLGNDTVDSGPRFSQESDAYADNIFMRISTLQVDIYN